MRVNVLGKIKFYQAESSLLRLQASFRKTHNPAAEQDVENYRRFQQGGWKRTEAVGGDADRPARGRVCFPEWLASGIGRGLGASRHCYRAIW
jgi:hypothetical protein